MIKIITHHFFKLLITSCLVLLAVFAHNKALSQTAASYTFSAFNAAYTPIVGTNIPTIQADDANFINIPLNFTFNFAGTNYTQVSASSNGWIAFSNTNPSATVSRNNTQANANTIGAMVMPLWDDLGGQTGAPQPTATYTTTGVAPNRVFTIEWKDWRWTFGSNPGVLSFQVKLFETTNIIQCCYTQGAVANTGTTATIGIFKTNTDWQTLNNATASPTSSSVTFTTSVATKPPTGQVYQWSPPAPCTGVPTTTASAPANVCPNTTFTLSCTQPAGTGITYQWYQATNIAGPFAPIAGATTANYNVTGGIAATTYYYVITNCSNSGQSYTSNTLTINVLPSNVCAYCASTATSTADEEILNVTLNTLNNSSTCATSNNMYSDYKPLGSLTTVLIGSTYTLSLQLGTCGGNFGRTAKVFIDYNRDGVYQNPGENVFTITYPNTTPNPQTATSPITIPITANAGITGMRVIYDETTNAALITPCLTYTWGETEDYLITLAVPPPCTGPPSISGPTATPNVFDCSGAPNLDLTTYQSTVANITYQWQSSPANQNLWTSISPPNPTPAFTAPSVTANTDYRVIAVCTNTNESTISPTITVTVNRVTAAPDTSNICLGSTQVLTATSPPAFVTLFSEDFNAVNSMVVTTSGSPGTQWTAQANNYVIPCSGTTFTDPTGTTFMLANADNNCNSSTTNTQLTSPLLNTTGFNTLTLTFNHYFRYLTGAAKVDVSIDGGLTWTTVQSYTATVGTSTAFAAATINLNAYTNQSNFKIRFNLICGWDWYWALDDVKLSGLSNSPSFAWVANPAANAGLPAAAMTLSPANNNISVTPTSGGTYVYTVSSNAPGCVAADAVVIVDPGPTGSMSFTSAAVCPGADDTVLFTGTPNATVTYTVNAGPAQTIVLDPAGNALVNTGPLSVNTTYTLVSVTAVNGCVKPYNTSSTITMNPVPVIDPGMPSSNTPVCSGNTLNLFVSTTPVSSTYSWTGPAFGTPDLNQNPVVNNALVSYTGTYTVTATTSLGCSVTGTTDVLINQTPSINVAASSPGTCSGSDGLITVSGLAANGIYTLYYTDTTNHVQSITANGSGMYFIQNLPAGTYTNIYVVQNNCTSNVANIAITDPPPPVISGITSSNPTLCGGLNGTVTLQGLLANTAYDLYYNNSGTPVNLTTNGAGNLVLGGLAAGTYSNFYVIRLNCTSNIVGPVTLSDPNAPNPPGVNDVVYCQFETPVALTATLSGNANDILKWYTAPSGGTGVTPGPVPSTNVPGTFVWYVTETDSLGCESNRVPQTVLIKPKPAVPTTTSPSFVYCQADSSAVPLVATGDSLGWYTVATGGTPSYTTPTPSTAVAGTFMWYVSQTQDGCESDRLPITVIIVPKPQPPVTKDLTYCQSDVPAQLTAVGDSLKWFDVPVGGTPLPTAPTPSTAQADTTTWYVSQTIAGCESDRAAITVIVFYRPTAEIVTGRDEICQGDTTLVTYVGNGSQTTTYDWTWPVGSNILSGQGQGPYVVQFNGVGSNTVTLMATENGCSSPLASHTINVKQVPVVTINLRNNIVCTGDPAYLDLTYANMPIANYLWTFNGAHTSDGSTTATGTGPYYLTWDNPGTYTVRLDVNTADECPGFAEQTVVVHEHPGAKINVATPINDLCSGADVVLSAEVNNARYTYQWAPQQLFDFNENNAVVTVHADASRYINLTVTNEYGCSSMDSIMLQTKPCCELQLPSAFSPNGDSKNDLFRIINPGRHKLLSLQVYNRYGQIVFSTSDEKTGWDGSLNGVAQEMGVYQYLVKYQCDGKDTFIKGEVTLVR